MMTATNLAGYIIRTTIHLFFWKRQQDRRKPLTQHPLSKSDMTMLHLFASLAPAHPLVYAFDQGDDRPSLVLRGALTWLYRPDDLGPALPKITILSHPILWGKGKG